MYLDAAATVTDDVNTVAAETGSAYIDLRAAFKGPDNSYDETHYLCSAQWWASRISEAP